VNGCEKQIVNMSSPTSDVDPLLGQSGIGDSKLLEVWSKL
jgi:ABC-type phosphate transport system ATPase subunit